MKALIIFLLLATAAQAGDASLQIVPTPQIKTGKKIGKWDEAKRIIVCGKLPEIMGVMKTQGAAPVFGGQTMQGEYVQLFRNANTGLWFFIAAGPKDGEGCSLGGGWQSISVVAQTNIHH